MTDNTHTRRFHVTIRNGDGIENSVVVKTASQRPTPPCLSTLASRKVKIFSPEVVGPWKMVSFEELPQE